MLPYSAHHFPHILCGLSLKKSVPYLTSTFGGSCQGMGDPAEEGTFKHTNSPKIHARNRKKLSVWFWAFSSRVFTSCLDVT